MSTVAVLCRSSVIVDRVSGPAGHCNGPQVKENSYQCNEMTKEVRVYCVETVMWNKKSSDRPLEFAGDNVRPKVHLHTLCLWIHGC